jgi:outer membrane protein assembly factor BamB
MTPKLLKILRLAFLLCGASLFAADQPQWGEAWTRNMVSSERGLPETFDAETGRNIKWIAKLGNETHSTPVVAGGRVFIGTNNDEPRDTKHRGDRGVLMCFDEGDGRLLWQLVVPKRSDDQYFDWPKCGISSPVTVEGERAYLVDNRGAVLCLDVHGLANGNDGPFREEGAYMTPRPAPPPSFESAAIPSDAALQPGAFDADIIWMFDMPSQAGIWPHDGAHSSIIVDGDLLYLNTGTGVDNSHRAIRTPNAPSIIVLDKATGALVARDNEHIAPRIFHCTWSSPSLATVNKRRLIFFAGGDGIVRTFEAVGKEETKSSTLRKVWQFDPDPRAPKEDVHRFTTNRQIGPSNVYGMPVFANNRIFLAGGGDVFWGKNEAWLKCIDATQEGDVTGSAELWSYPLERHVLSTPAVHDGLVFIADTGRKLHCVDAATGRPVWTHDIEGDAWASPMIADDKVFIGTRKGDFWILAATKEKRVLGSISLKRPISATATAANGVLYVATMTHLYAVKAGAEEHKEADQRPAR